MFVFYKRIIDLLARIQTHFNLIKHPLEANCHRALIFWSTTEPIKIVNYIYSLYNWRNIVPSILNREYFPIRAYIKMTI